MSREDGQVYADNLVTVGFFNHCRNPLYLGNILILTGLVVVHNHPLAYLVLPAAWFGYSAIVAAKEAYLAQRFGDEYSENCRRVARWQLRLWGLRASLAGMRFQWRTVVDNEHTTTYSWMAGILTILAYEVLAWHAARNGLALVEGMGATFAIVTLAWSTAFYWKKSRVASRRNSESLLGLPRPVPRHVADCCSGGDPASLPGAPVAAYVAARAPRCERRSDMMKDEPGVLRPTPSPIVFHTGFTPLRPTRCARRGRVPVGGALPPARSRRRSGGRGHWPAPR